MIGWFLSVAAATAPGACDPATLRPAITAAATALQKKDLAAARTAIGPAAACPVVDGTTYTAHVLAADIAVSGQEWKAAQAALAGVGVHPESPLSPRAGFVRLRADQGAGDTAAFAADRAALLAANDARLAGIGKRGESFRAGGMTVQAYEAGVTQGAFRRATEFIATPDDPAAYPVSVLLGQDSMSSLVADEASGGKDSAPKQAVWFLDLYTCTTHATLSTDMTAGPPPPYAETKAKVIAALEGRAKPTTSSSNKDAACYGGQWLLPGLGGR